MAGQPIAWPTGSRESKDREGVVCICVFAYIWAHACGRVHVHIYACLQRPRLKLGIIFLLPYSLRLGPSIKPRAG